MSLLNFHMHRSKRTIQQLYSPWLNRKKERRSLCNAQEKLTPGLSLRPALAITIRGEGGTPCQIRPRESLKKRKDSIPQEGLENFFFLRRPPSGTKVTFQSHVGSRSRSRFLCMLFFCCWFFLFFFKSALITGVFYSSRDHSGSS